MHVPVGAHLITLRAKSVSHAFGKEARPKGHQGWDIAAFTGSPIYAITDGTIEFVHSVDDSKYGKQVCLRFIHKGRTLYAFYAHLDTIDVKANDVVTEGQKLGTSGQTGTDAKLQHHSEAHLHFEIRAVPRPGPTVTPNHIDPATIFGWGPVVDALTSDVREAVRAATSAPLPKWPK
jgi:murein DD-endopeptidase MepM/ murein hydrolase activator NlpD